MPTKKFPVEASHVMMFARAVGDFNEIYHDEDYAKATDQGSIIAPPTFVQAHAQFDPDYHLRPKPGQPWFGSGRNATGMPPDSGGTDKSGMRADILHAEQHYEYHRHPKVGDVLSVTTKPGKTWEKQGRRGGNLHFMESITEYRDQHGELVVTARSVGVRTERPATED